MNTQSETELILVQNLITKKEKYFKVIGADITPTTKSDFKEEKKYAKFFFSKILNNKFDVNIYTKNFNEKGVAYISKEREESLLNRLESILNQSEQENTIKPIVKEINKSEYKGYYLKVFKSHIGISAQLVNDLEISTDYKLKIYSREKNRDIYVNFFDFDSKESSLSMGLTKLSRTGIDSEEFPILIYLKADNPYIDFEELELIGKKLEIDIEPETIYGEPWYYVNLDAIE